MTHPRTAKTLSVLYSPHGLTYEPLMPYASSHLVRHAALPLTALIHGFDRVQNPWWMGGNVNAGLPGGVEIAKNLMAKHWISAHDEEKENSGLAVMKVTMRKYALDDVTEMAAKQAPGCNVRVLACGEEMAMKA